MLLGNIKLGGSVAGILALANTVDLVVDRGTVVVTHLTSTGNSPLDVGRMPCTDTSDLAETLVGLARKLLGAPTGGDTLETVTLGDGDAVNHLVLLEDGADVKGLLEEAVSELDLVGNGATVDLDLHKVSLLLLERGLADLGVGKNTDDSAVLLDALEVTGDGRAAVLRVLLGVLGEGLLLALVPALVEAALDLVREMLGPDGGQGAETTGSLDVANKTDNDHLHFAVSLLRSAPSCFRLGFRECHTGGVSMTVQASTISFLWSLAPGRSRSRTMVVIPAL